MREKAGAVNGGSHPFLKKKLIPWKFLLGHLAAGTPGTRPVLQDEELPYAAAMVNIRSVLYMEPYGRDGSFMTTGWLKVLGARNWLVTAALPA